MGGLGQGQPGAGEKGSGQRVSTDTLARFQERRRWARHPEERLVAYTWCHSDELTRGMGMAHTVDLSEGGVGIRVHQELGEGSILHMFMAVEEQLVEAKVIVVHQRRMPDGFYQVGARFLSLDEKGRRYTGSH